MKTKKGATMVKYLLTFALKAFLLILSAIMIIATAIRVERLL